MVLVRAKLFLRNEKMLAARERLGLTQKACAGLAGVPVAVVQELERFQYTRKDFGQAIRRIADVLELRIEDVAPPELQGLKIESSASVVKEIDGRQLAMAADQKLLSPAEVAEAADLREHAQRMLASVTAELSFREREVLRRRYGLLPYDKPQSYREIGDALRLTRERIRQIEQKAIRKLAKQTSLKRLGCEYGVPIKQAAEHCAQEKRHE